MYNSDKFPKFYAENGEFIDFAFEDEKPEIVDFRYMDREIII